MPKRNYRKRQESDEDENEDTDLNAVFEETKELQKFRKRPKGVSAAGLALGENVSEEDKLAPDPFKLKTGGLVTLKQLDDATQLHDDADEVMKRLSSTFSAETNKREDEERMLKYIEEEMKKKKKGVTEVKEKLSDYEAKIEAMYKVPEHLEARSKSTSEDMLSNQMLSGIPEVDLGLEAKFKNIEATELAKRKILEEECKKKKEDTSFVAANVAANYTHQSLRFNKARGSRVSKAADQSKRPEAPVYVPVVGEHDNPEYRPMVSMETSKRKTDKTQIATDDFHFDKYKKKARKY
ncbi:splicing factor C9orf78 homolog [Dysidea avara]|uniref:splicing factor C9orf78 homolog n=1 Tax=Dysidea avara TaxID=196820 RepID=UPI0033326460